MNDVIVARVLHVLGVVVWIGGVSMVTTVVLPALRRGDLGGNRLKAFEALERRFAWQARSAIVVVGLSGLYLLWRLKLWHAFRTPAFWWLHAMVALWLLFALALFVAEPLLLRRRLSCWAEGHPDATFAWLQRVHSLLLALAIVIIIGAVAGSWGWSGF